jgi:hypothetical protein
MFSAIYDKLSSMEDELLRLKQSNELLQTELSHLRNDFESVKNENVSLKDQIIVEINNNVYEHVLKTKTLIGTSGDKMCYVDKNITYADFVKKINEYGKGENCGTLRLNLRPVKELQNIREIDLADIARALKCINRTVNLYGHHESDILFYYTNNTSDFEVKEQIRNIFSNGYNYRCGSIHCCLANFLKNEFQINFLLDGKPLWTP